MLIYTVPMNAPLSPQSLIEQILQIQRMEHGSLSIIGQGPNGPYYNLNSWEEGKNRCRYLPQDKVPEVQEQTRAQLSIGVKKKPQPNPAKSRPKSAWPKTRKSST